MENILKNPPRWLMNDPNSITTKAYIIVVPREPKS